MFINLPKINFKPVIPDADRNPGIKIIDDRKMFLFKIVDNYLLAYRIDNLVFTHTCIPVFVQPDHRITLR